MLVLRFKRATLKRFTYLSALFFLLVSFALPFSVTAPAPNFGQIMAGEACFYEVAGVVHLNQSPCTAQLNQYAYSNLSNKFGITIPITTSIETTNLVVVSDQQLKTVTKIQCCTEVNLTSITHGNGTVQNISNFTSSLYNVTEWVELPRQSFVYDGRTWEGITISLNAGGLQQFREKLAPKSYGGIIKYSRLANASGLYAELDPLLNATASNITTNSDLNLSIAGITDLARFVDGKLVMGAGNRSNLTAWDTWSDNELLASPAWIQVNATGGAGTFVARADGGSLNITVLPTTSHSSVTVMRTGNLSIPATGGIGISFSLDTGLGGGVPGGFMGCFVYDFNIVANKTGGSSRCGMEGLTADATYFRWAGSSEIFMGDLDAGIVSGDTSFITSVFVGGIVTYDWYINKTHTRLFMNRTKTSEVSTTIRAIGTGITSNSGGQFAFTLMHDSATVRNAVIDNFTITNMTEFAQPVNLTPARFETILLNATITVDNIKITNLTLSNANTQATWFAMDNNSKNQQAINPLNAFVDITDFNGIKINGTFTPNGLYTATELTSILIETTAGVSSTEIVSMGTNGTNVTSFIKGQVASFFANFTTSTGTTLTSAILQHNITAAGILTNVTIPASGTSFNASVNLTILHGNTTQYGIKWYANTSTYVNNSIPNSTIVTSNSAPTIIHQIQFVNYTNQHSFNASFAVDDADGVTTLTQRNVSITAGGCSHLLNTTTATQLNLTFNCTGTGLATTKIQINVSDSSNSGVASTELGAVYPNTQPPSPSFTFPASNAYVNSMNHSLNYTSGVDADGDSIIYYIFFERQLNKTAAGNTTMNFSDRETTQINVSAYDGANWSINVTLNYSIDVTLPSLSNGSNDVNVSGFRKANHVGVNFTWVEIHNSSVFVRNGSRGTISNTTPIMNATYFRFNFTALDDANYTFSAWMNDTAGNVGTTTDISIAVDTTLPFPIFSFPTPDSGTFTSTRQVNISFNITELYFKNATVSIYNLSGILLNETRFTIPNSSLNYTLNDANYTVNVTAYDLAENSNKSVDRTFTVDTTLPAPDFMPTTPTNASYASNNRVNISINVSETNFRNVTIRIGNASGILNDTWFTNPNVSVNYTLNDAAYLFNMTAYDQANNSNTSILRNFTVDTINPTLTLVSTYDTNNTIVGRNYIALNITMNETNRKNLTIRLKNGTATASTINISGNSTPLWNLFNFTGLADQLYNISVTATDLADNINNTFPNISITVDTTAPNVSIELPLQDAKVDPTFLIQFQVNDSIGVSQCNITSGVLGTITNGTALNVSNGNENNHLNSSGLLPGNQVSFSVRCADYVGNTATSLVRTFSIAEIAGAVSGGDSGVHGDVTTKKQCGAGETPFVLNGTDYCTPCTGKIATYANGSVFVAADGKAQCVESTTTTQAELNPFQSLPQSKGATILMLMAAVAYAVFGTNLVFRKKPKVKELD